MHCGFDEFSVQPSWVSDIRRLQISPIDQGKANMKKPQASTGNEPIVLAHVVWMDRYDGDFETIYQAGWRWDLVGHEGEATGEQFNFIAQDGSVRGYVARFHLKDNGEREFKKMAIERLGARRTAESYGPVTVVWTATPPDGGDRVIVGWYKGATAYREPQAATNPRGQAVSYFFSAKPDSCYLVPPKFRHSYRIKSSHKAGAGGGPGMDSLFYPAKELTGTIAGRLKELAKTLMPLSQIVTSAEGSSQRRGPRQPDIETRLAVEKAAMKAVQERLSDNCEWVDVSALYEGWDIAATKKGGKQNLLVEVKGLSGSTAIVDLTPKEYTKFLAHGSGKNGERYIVAIVTDALTNLQKVSFYGKSGKDWVPFDPSKNAFVKLAKEKLLSKTMTAARLTVVSTV